MVRSLQPDKRETFLAAALRLFVANGVPGTSTAEIAREAGTAAGTLFLYFPTKQDLVNALILKIGRAQAEAITAHLEPDQSARDAFATIWNGSVGWFRENLDAYLYVQQVRDSGWISAPVVQESEQFFGFYYAAIQKGLAEGSIQPYPAELIGEFLYRGIIATMNLVRRQPDPATQDEYIRLGFEIFWDGIKTATASPSGEPE